MDADEYRPERTEGVAELRRTVMASRRDRQGALVPEV
jgi:hypothetical protein